MISGGDCSSSNPIVVEAGRNGVSGRLVPARDAGVAVPIADGRRILDRKYAAASTRPLPGRDRYAMQRLRPVPLRSPLTRARPVVVAAWGPALRGVPPITISPPTDADQRGVLRSYGKPAIPHVKSSPAILDGAARTCGATSRSPVDHETGCAFTAHRQTRRLHYAAYLRRLTSQRLPSHGSWPPRSCARNDAAVASLDPAPPSINLENSTTSPTGSSPL